MIGLYVSYLFSSLLAKFQHVRWVSKFSNAFTFIRIPDRGLHNVACGGRVYFCDFFKVLFSVASSTI